MSSISSFLLSNTNSQPDDADFRTSNIKASQVDKTEIAATLKSLDSHSRMIVFIPLDQAVMDYIVEQPYCNQPVSGVLPPYIRHVLNSLEIGEERFMKAVTLAPTATYESEQNKFFSFCIPEHHLRHAEIKEVDSSVNISAKRLVGTHKLQVLFNDKYTVVVHPPNSEEAAKLKSDIASNKICYFRDNDSLPCVTTLVKDVLEKNKAIMMRFTSMFHAIKNQHISYTDVYVFSAFEMILAEFQNYWTTECQPESQIATMLDKIKKGSEEIENNLFLNEGRFAELKDTVETTTGRTKNLTWVMALRDDVRTKVVENRSQYSENLRTTGYSAVLPNALAFVISPILTPTLEIAAHVFATGVSLVLIAHLNKLHWFDFIIDQFGDLFDYKEHLNMVKELFLGSRRKTTAAKKFAHEAKKKNFLSD